MLKTFKLRTDPDPHNLLQHFYLTRLPKIISSEISCLTVAKVTRYKKSQHECSVQPLPKQSDNNKRPIYNYVIVPESIWKLDEIMKKLTKTRTYNVIGGKGGHIKIDDIKPKWKPLKRGSVVVIGAMDRELDNFNGKQPYKIETDRMHSYNDAIVLGVIHY